MFRIITINLNGIRSAAKKGFFAWLQKQNADIICMQEIKAQESDLQEDIFKPRNYHAYFHYAEKKGYSGVAIFTKQKPQHIVTGLGWPEADQEGRHVMLDFGNYSVASLYMPSGTSGEERQTIKFDFLKRYELFLKKLPKEKHHIICGDWNIAHKQIDLKNWRGNQKNSGFLPEERMWMDNLFGNLQFIDAFREINKEPDQYTWWSNRGQAYAKNVGWRIDYQVVTPTLQQAIKTASIYKDERFSDHAPLLIDYEF
ncbi:DNA-(apurinic or apyrimidinic site) lyase [Gammaproteobacteria bacterium SCGC AG-212-F23]|nr:DNA-(apurinic or apyrimidinic site) lyase [Gammaproteobacteria bacterium SCGC AG-212-F23]